jgi:hypothetical protein
LVEQQLRMMAPMLGRLQTELLGPMVTRTYDMMKEKNRWSPAPASLKDSHMAIKYTSAAARAQVGSKAALMGRYLQELIPLAQVDPTVMDAVDMKAYAQELAIIRGVTRKIMRTPEQLEELDTQRQQQQQLAAAAEIAKPASEAVKNLAQANEMGNIV